MNEHGALVGWEGKRILREKNLFQVHFLHQKSHVDWPGIEPERNTAWATEGPKALCRAVKRGHWQHNR